MTTKSPPFTGSRGKAFSYLYATYCNQPGVLAAEQGVDEREIDNLAELRSGAVEVGTEGAVAEATNPVEMGGGLDVAIGPVGWGHVGVVSKRPGVCGSATGNHDHLDHFGAADVAAGQETRVGSMVSGAGILIIAADNSLGGEGFDVLIGPVGRLHIGVALLPASGSGDGEAVSTHDDSAELGAGDIVVGVEVAIGVAADTIAAVEILDVAIGPVL